jgi:hypothetical protein
MKTGDQVKVWNHTLGGELFEEGTARLCRRDPDFKNQTIQRLATSYTDENAKEGQFERWMVLFPNDGKMSVSRWVRDEDNLTDPFAVANKRLGKLAKELSKDPELKKIL